MALEVLVTGAAGVLGRSIVSTLRQTGYGVVACARQQTAGVDAVWDISWQDAPSTSCHPDVVVHAAAAIGRYQHPIEEADSLFEVNVNGTLRVAKWCVSNDVKRLVLISGALVYGKWDDAPKTEGDAVQPWFAGAYAVSKYCSEQAASMVQASGMELSVLRLSSLYGSGYRRGIIQRLLSQGIENHQITLSPPFDDAFDLLHVSDAADAVRMAVEHPASGPWNVGGGSLTAIGELADLCAAQTNAEVVRSDVLTERSATILNWVEDAKARAELGHTNRVSLERGIAGIAESLRGELVTL